MAKSKAVLLKEIKKLQQDITDLQSEGVSLSKSELDQQDKLQRMIVSRAREIRKINEIQQERAVKTQEMIIDQELGMKSLGGIYTNIKSIENKRLDILRSSSIESEHNLQILKNAQQLNERIANLTSDDVFQRDVLNNKLNTELGNLRGRGKALDDQVSLLRQSNVLANQHASISKHQKELLEAQLETYETMKKTVGGILDTVGLLASKAGFGMVTIAAGFVVDKIAEVNKELGMTGFSLTGVASKTALMNVFFDDAVGTTKELANQFGGVEAASFGTQLNTNLLARNLGISGGEAAKLMGSFARLNGGSKDVAKDLMVSTKELAKQRGVIPSQVMADLANNTEAFALYAKNGGKNLAEASVFAAQLGTSMSTLTTITDSLLDFESSITGELELSAMLGRNINLNRARELAYANDIKGSVRETLNQLGGIDEFNQMDVFQKRQAAQLLGISVGELQQMVALEAEAGKESGFLVTNFNRVSEALSAASNTLGGKFLKGLGSGMVMVGQMSGGLQNLIPKGLGDKLGGIFSKAGGASGGVTESIQGRITESTDIASKTPKKSDGGLKSLAKGLKEMGDAKVLFGALNLIPTALGFIAILAGIPGMLAVAALGVPVGAGLKAMGRGLKSFGQTVAKALPQIGIGLLVLAGFGAAMIPLAYALELAAPAISAFGDVIKGAFTGIATVVTAVANGLVSMLSVITLEKAGAMYTLAAAFPVLAIGIGLLGVAALLNGKRVITFINSISEAGSLLAGGASDAIQTTASSMMSMANALLMINNELDRLSVEKLDALADFSMNVSVGSAVTTIGESVGGLVNSVAGVIGAGESGVVNESVLSGETNNTSAKLEDLITEMKGLRDELKQGKIAVYLDRDKVSKNVATGFNESSQNAFGLL